MPRFITVSSCVFALSAAIGSAAAAGPPILSTTGDAVEATPPASILYNQWQSDAEIRVWHERYTQIQADTYLGFTNTGLVNSSNQQIAGNIPAGTWINSTMIRIDPVSLVSIRRSGSVTFDQPILGVELGAGLGIRDALYAKSGVTYNNNDFRGLELFGSESEFTDSFEISADRLTVSFAFEIGDWTDDLRVITQAPCPVDLNGDGIYDNGDIYTFISLFLAGDIRADVNGDGFLCNGDIGHFVNLYLAGC